MAQALFSDIGAGFLLSCLFVVRYVLWCWCLYSLRFLLGFQSFWAEATCSDVPLPTVFTFECYFFVVFALVGCVSSCSIPAGRDL